MASSKLIRQGAGALEGPRAPRGMDDRGGQRFLFEAYSAPPSSEDWGGLRGAQEFREAEVCHCPNLVAIGLPAAVQDCHRLRSRRHWRSISVAVMLFPSGF